MTELRAYMLGQRWASDPRQRISAQTQLAEAIQKYVDDGHSEYADTLAASFAAGVKSVTR